MSHAAQQRGGTRRLPGLSAPSSRRCVVLATGVAVLAACSDDEETPIGPRRRPRRSRDDDGRQQARAGQTVLTQADLEEVARKLTEHLEGDDLQAFLAATRPSDSAMWRRMWEGLHAVPTTDRRFLLQSARPGWRNRRGGPVSAVVRGVVAYRIEGCDAEPMAHLCDLSVFKSPDGAVRVQTLGPLRDEGSAPWLLTPVSAATAGNVVLISRATDAGTAGQILSAVDRGAGRALDFIAPPAGVSKICVTLGWPGAEDTLYGGSAGEFVGSAHSYRYVDPQQLAETGRRGPGEVFQGSRVVIEPGAMAAQGAEAVTAHESIHALAFQWGQSAPPLYAEGLARYFELGAPGTVRAARRLGAAAYRDFARRVTARPGRAAFYDETWQEANYTAAAMTCAHVAREHGGGALRDLVRAAYDGAADPARTVLAMSQDALLREVAAWLEEQEDREREARRTSFEAPEGESSPSARASSDS
jgi:hypothetical protein